MTNSLLGDLLGRYKGGLITVLIITFLILSITSLHETLSEGAKQIMEDQFGLLDPINQNIVIFLISVAILVLLTGGIQSLFDKLMSG